MRFTRCNPGINMSVHPAFFRSSVSSLPDYPANPSDEIVACPPWSAVATPPHIFDLFAQSSRTIAAGAGALGIGLTVVKAIAAAHGGTASASSSGAGSGSQFLLRLPVIAVRQNVRYA